MLHSGFGNQQDQVGRYFMETIDAAIYLEIELDFVTHRGPPLDSRIWDYCKPVDNNSAGFVLGSSSYLDPGTGPSRHAINQQGIGRAHKQSVRETFGRNLVLFGIAEQEPVATNRISLSDTLDKYGVPKVNVHCEYSQRDHNTIDLMHEKLTAWQQATPNTTINKVTNTRSRSSATHVAGTCRMGNDPQHSVVDAFGKVHGSKNCYITDGSVMPTQGAGDSPSLTIQALALRTADRIVEDLKSV